MSIASQITRIQNAKAALKNSIEAKGVSVGAVSIDQYASKVDAISTGGVVGTGSFLVRFFDFDGTILKQQRVNAGENATAPTVPTHQYLTFNSWNNAFTNVQSDIDTGAIYDTTDGKSYLFITLTSVTGLSPTLYLNKSTTSIMTVNWGDGTTSTSTTSGNFNLNHTYSSAGYYIVTVDNSLGGTYTLAQDWLAPLFVTGTYNYILTSVYFGSHITYIPSNCFDYNYSLKYVSFSPGINEIHQSAFRNCGKIDFFSYANITNIGYFSLIGFSLSTVVVKNTLTTLGLSFLDSLSVINFTFPPTTTTIGQAAFRNCKLKIIILGGSMTSIADYVFYNCNSVEQFVILAVVPPTLQNINSFTGINQLCRIYVPDASVTAYKTATNWSTYANYIYPLSSRPIQ